jgi:hypothetical protein
MEIFAGLPCSSIAKILGVSRGSTDCWRPVILLLLLPGFDGELVVETRLMEDGGEHLKVALSDNQLLDWG